MTGGAETMQYIRKLKFLINLFSCLSINSVAPIKSPLNCIAKADSGCSAHFIKSSHRNILQNLIPLKNGPIAALPNKSVIRASHQGFLPFKNVSRVAQKTLVYPNLTNASLLSIGQFCDDECIAVFTKSSMYVIKNNDLVVHGHRNPLDGLWDIRLPQVLVRKESPTSPNRSVNYIIRKDKSATDLARYYHAALFSPPLSTLSKAIANGNLVTWPGIDQIQFQKILDTTIALEKGHLDQERKNLQSTTPTNKDEIEDNFPSQEQTKTYNIFAMLEKTDESFTAKHKTCSDQTGKFPHISSRGNQYVFTLYDYDSNVILLESLKSKQGKEIATTYTKCNKKLTRHGHQVTLHVLDNECCEYLKAAFKKAQVQFELVPPHMHRRNAAERAIRTAKNHLLAGLATCDPAFPVQEWDRLLPQAELTLNLLRTSRINPSLSAWAYINGIHDFNKSPLAPPGTKVVLHKKPSIRASWAYHGKEGWYIGPSPNHYRCLKIYVPETHAEVDTDTVKFIPRYIPIPECSIDDHLRRSANDIVQLLLHKTKVAPALIPNSTREALLKLASILNRDSTPRIKNIVPSTLPTAQSTPNNAEYPTPPTTKKQISAPTIYKSSTKKNARVRWASPVCTFFKGDNSRSIEPMKNLLQKALTKNITKSRLATSKGVKTKGTKSKKKTSTTKLHNPPKMTLPHRATFTIPTAKQQRPSFPPKQLRRSTRPRMQRYDYTAPTKAYAVQCLILQENVKKIMHIYNENGKKLSLDALLQGEMAVTWQTSLSNELGRLAQGVRQITGNNVIDFIPIEDVPPEKKVTYANMVCDYRPLKSDPYRVRLTVGGDRLEYWDDAASPAASLVETKLLLNSVISDAHKNARFMTIDIKDFFLQSFMKDAEYMRIHSKYFFKISERNIILTN